MQNAFWDYMPNTKFCSNCHTRKPFSEFSPDLSKKHGLRIYCKDCSAAVRKRDRKRKRLERGYHEKPLRQFVAELYAWQAGECAACERPFDQRNLEVDHIVPQSQGGSDDRANLQLLCHACNAMKWTRTMRELLDDLHYYGVLP